MIAASPSLVARSPRVQASRFWEKDSDESEEDDDAETSDESSEEEEEEKKAPGPSKCAHLSLSPYTKWRLP